MTTGESQGRRVEDAINNAVAIAEIKGSIKNLEILVTQSIKHMETQIELVQRDHRDQDRRSDALEERYVKERASLKSEVLKALREHTHDDPSPHQPTVGTRLDSLESTRTYFKGVLAFGAVVMPIASAFIFKWIESLHF